MQFPELKAYQFRHWYGKLENMLPPVFEIVSVFAVGFIAGFIGPITGGGGLLIIPVLMLFGLSAQTAISSTRLGALGLWIFVIRRYQQNRAIDWSFSFRLMLVAVPASFIGAQLLVFSSPEFVDRFVGLILLLMIPVLYLKPAKKLELVGLSKGRKLFGYLLFFFVMIFAAFFSGGDGTLGILVLNYVFGMSIIESNANRGFAWLVMGIIAVSQYCYEGMVNYPYALCLFVGMGLGGHWGAHSALLKGEMWVKKVFTLIVLLLALLLFWK